MSLVWYIKYVGSKEIWYNNKLYIFLGNLHTLLLFAHIEFDLSSTDNCVRIKNVELGLYMFSHCCRLNMHLD